MVYGTEPKRTGGGGGRVKFVNASYSPSHRRSAHLCACIHLSSPPLCIRQIRLRQRGQVDSVAGGKQHAVSLGSTTWPVRPCNISIVFLGITAGLVTTVSHPIPKSQPTKGLKAMQLSIMQSCYWSRLRNTKHIFTFPPKIFIFTTIT